MLHSSDTPGQRPLALTITRHADLISEGIERARLVLAGGDVAIAAHLLDVPAEDIRRIAGEPPAG